MYLCKAVASITLLTSSGFAAQQVTFSNAEMDFARFGTMFHLTRGATNAFDPGLTGNHAGRWSGKTFEDINDSRPMQILLRMGHGMVHNYLDHGAVAYLQGGATMTPAVFDRTYKTVKHLYTSIRILASRRNWRSDIRTHWTTYWDTIDTFGEPSYPPMIAGGPTIVYDVPQDSNTVKFARLAVICALSRKVTDYYDNRAAPLGTAHFEFLEKNWRTLVKKNGQLIAHQKSQTLGLELEEYSYFFLQLEQALITMQNHPDHVGGAGGDPAKQIPYAANGYVLPQTPIQDALDLINTIRANGGNYNNLQPCRNSLESFKQAFRRTHTWHLTTGLKQKRRRRFR